MRIIEILITKEEQALKNIGDPSLLLGKFTIEDEELVVAEAIEGGSDAAAFEQSLDAGEDDFDPFEALMAAAGEAEETGEKKEVPFLRYYNVFHIDQCEGLKARHAEPLLQVVNPDQQAEDIIRNYLNASGVKLARQEGNRAFYRPSTDSITLPIQAQFKATSEYYSTAFHELTHSTGHASRLDRLSKTAYFGSEAYSKEELIAEIGAAALVNHTGLETPDSFRNNAAYIQNWLQVLKDDKRFIVSAAGKAEKAVNLILGSAG